MLPQLALALNAALVFWLFRRDMRVRELPSSALWIPAIWLVILGSRTLTQWLATVGIIVGGTSNLEGSPLDMAVFLGLIVSAVVVLARRGFDWAAFVRTNKVLIAIYLYCALSALWSEYSLPTLKRAIKDFGNVLVALVFLSELDPFEAIQIVYVRVSYLLFPLSIVLIKYFPAIGRVPSRSHENMFAGVTTHKNALGELVLVLGLFLIVDLVQMRQRREGQDKTDERIRYGMLAFGLWLLLTCNSVASVICFALGCFLLWVTGRLLQMQDPKQMLFRCLTAIVCVATLEYCLNISGIILGMLGRDATLTGRTEIWDMVEKAHTDPIVGCGFYSFWTTEAAQEISALYLGTLGTTHNGLLEMYLDGGYIGLALLILLLLVWGRRSVQQMLEGTLRGRLTLTFWLLAVIHNFSETGYFRLTPLWFTLILLMIKCPPSRQTISVANATTSGSALHAA
jgi:exopolysaccharide production protein ExoQ